MSMVQAQHEFLQDMAALIIYAGTLGFQVTAGEFQRTDYQQAEYLRTGKTQRKHSIHQDRLAGDLNFFQYGIYINGLPADEAKRILQPVGDFWERLRPGNSWGGNWKSFIDTPHFQGRRD